MKKNNSFVFKIKKTIEESFEIPVPSYWKDGYCFYRVYHDSVNDTIKVDAIHDWYPTQKLEFVTNYAMNALAFDKFEQITQSDWLTVLDKVYDKIQLMLNQMLPQDGAMYIIAPTLVPTEEPKSN